MTADELQRIVLRLANQCPTRYWLLLDYPKYPGRMAIGLSDIGDGWSRIDIDLQGRGFERISPTEAFRMGVEQAWVIERTE